LSVKPNICNQIIVAVKHADHCGLIEVGLSIKTISIHYHFDSVFIIAQAGVIEVAAYNVGSLEVRHGTKKK
jgi:hypothetical protein